MNPSVSERPARPEGWELRLAAAITAAAARPWSWGEHDCFSFAVAAARATLDGPCAWDGWAGRHRTALGAARVIRFAGVETLADLVGLGAPRIPVALAQRGDWALIRRGEDGWLDEDGAAAIGVIDGARVLAATRPRGLVALPLAVAEAAWPVDPI